MRTSPPSPPSPPLPKEPSRGARGATHGLDRGGLSFGALVTGNPMLVEVRRAVRRYLSFFGAGGSLSLGLLLGIVAYALLMIVVINTRGDIPAKVPLFIHLFVAAVVAPMTLHASIAGERERRSWDMLMVAPVTHAQVVVGKLFGGLAVQLAMAAAMLVPTLVAAATYARGDGGTSAWGLVRSEVLILATGVFASGLTMLISARVKRAFVSLGVSMGALLFLFAFFPLLTGSLLGGSGPETEMLFLGWHPGWALGTIDAKSFDGESRDFALNGLVQALGLFVFGLIFTVWTIRTVAFADNEVRFLPGKRKRAAE